MKRFLMNYARLWWVSATLTGIVWEAHCIYYFRLIGPLEMVDIIRQVNPDFRVAVVLLIQLLLCIAAVAITLDQIDAERRKAK